MDFAETERGSERVTDVQLDERMRSLEDLSIRWKRMDPVEFNEVMTSAHFATYFDRALSRAFWSDYEYQGGQWKNYTYADEAPDFTDVERLRMTEPGTLHKRREKAEPKPTYVTDSHVTYGVEEYSNQFDVSWQTLVNDDLGKIKETPIRMARAARRFEDSFVSNLYDNATTQATLAALGAPWSGTGRLTTANLAIGLNAMKQRTDVNGNLIEITRVYLVIPPILEIQQGQMLNNLLSFGGPGGNELGKYIAGIYTDPYITTAGANVPWYLFADPSEIPAVPVARLRGWPGPITAMKRSDIQMISGSAPAAFGMGSFMTGDIEWEVVDVIGGWDDGSLVGVTDRRGIYYSSGTTV
jgi:hypothetical protein